jgi:hypothetical protein
MVNPSHSRSSARVAIVQWTARVGAVTAEALADHLDTTPASARARLLAAERAQMIAHQRPLARAPALYTATPAGLRMSEMRGLDPCRVSASNARHLIACASVAAALERCYPNQRVLGERELRRDERARGAQLASAHIGIGPDRRRLLHRPDLVLWPNDPDDGLPVAVEVELSVKSPRRLADICRAWARSQCVAGTLYLVSPDAGRAVERAVEETQAGDRIVVVGLDALPRREAEAPSREPSQAMHRLF